MVKADTDLSTAFKGDDSFAPSSQGGDIVVLDADAGGSLVLPDGFLVLGAKFVHDGPDLLLQGPNGDTVLIKDYFAQADHPKLIMANGGEVSGDLVDHLAHGRIPGQYAQAQNANAAAPIGKVSVVQGTATVFHADGTNEQLAVDTPIYQGDTVETSEGADVGLVFADNSTFALGQNGRVVINELIYNPDNATGSALMSIVKGVAVLVSGEIAKTDPNAMQVKTPVSTLLVRGTKTGIEVNETNGETLVVLFEEEGASKLGEIVILNDAGSQVLNQLNVAIRVATLNTPPSDPFTFLTDLIQQKFGGVLQFVPDQAALENFQTAAGGDGATGDGNIGDLAGQGSDTVAGGGGADTLTGGTGGDGGGTGGGFVDNTPPPPLVIPTTDTTPDDPNELLIGTPGPDLLDGAAGNDTIIGLDGNDTLIGGIGDDSLVGGNGDDLLNSGSGDDTVFGGDGSDTIIGGSGAGNDYYDGGDGVDTVDYSSTNAGIDVNLSVGYAIGSEIGTDTLTGIENVIGGNGDDTIVGNDVANMLVGGNGDDVLAGGGGSDTLIGGPGTDTAVFEGNAANYTITFGNYGGEGTGAIFVTDNVGDGGTDTLVGIEQLVFEGAPLAIDGTNIAPYGLVLTGDTVNENRAGVMIGTLAALDFNSGDTHTYAVNDSRFEIKNGNELWLKAGESLNYEADHTVAVNVTVTDSGLGNLSADHTVTINVNDVNESPTVNDQTLSVGEHLAAGTVVGTIAATDPDTPGTSFATLTYGFLPGPDNALFAINSSTGEITTAAEFDHDTAASYTLTVGVVDGGPPLIFDTATVTINIGDTFTGTTGDDSLVGTVGADVINGDAGNDTLMGGDGADTLIGGDGSDQINGGAGFDLLDYSTDASSGGTGSVTVDLSSNTATDGFLNIDSVTGVEFVRGTNLGDVMIGNDAGIRFEGLGGADSLTGGAGSDTLLGGDGADTLSGGGGSDSLVGGNGADTLSGGDGSDTLVGGADADTLTGGGGADFFVFHAPTDGGDVITDFTTGQDAIQVDGAAFGGLGAGTLQAGVNFSVIAGPYDGTDAGTNSNFASGDATFVYSQADGVLYYDDNGAAAGYTAIADTGGAPVNAADVHVS